MFDNGSHDLLLHPDLAAIGASMRNRLDAVLEAEQSAAAVAARRGCLLRDRLLEIEDRGLPAKITTRHGDVEGEISVAADHVAVEDSGKVALIPFAEIVMVATT